ncbi:HNH endonuclease [Mammaliicoccus sciuri]|uniref:HNH endonuclease n=1 Tax=Mammaliicoccus sciuri TaxID=1296 RepID=UPI002DBFF0BC|nr:HNH endonuclease signature motif containing protein [Mammaliicoccus sciuri]MEB6256784.1 HNH endonuclease [Mammaliicoccus sciuri]
MFEFHNISTKNEEYVDTKEKYAHELKNFEKYAEDLTNKAGKAIKGSQKASSYKRSLVRLIIGYNLIFNETIETIEDFEAYKKLLKITELKGFKEFNKNTNHFYSATIGCLLSYLTSLNSINEDEVDLLLNNPNPNQETNNLINFGESEVKKVKRKNKKLVHDKLYYPRNYNESLRAKINSNYQCEYDENHKTFINEWDRNPHVEAHHLIPMAAQSLYDLSIDFSENIVSLCPNCHRRIHHAVNKDKKEMLEYFFNNRKDIYSERGIDITLKELYRMYGILR